LIGCPISKSLTTCCVCLELRSLPSTGVTRLQRYYEPLRHPRAPGLSLAGIRLAIAGHTLGLPVLRTLSLCTCCRHYPGAAAGRTLRSTSPSRISLPRKGCRVGLRIVLFEACSAFTRVTACTLALSPIRDTLTEGFSHFVSSMTAPVASGWSGCRVGLAPTGKRRLSTAHTQLRHSAANIIIAWAADGAQALPTDEDGNPGSNELRHMLERDRRVTGHVARNVTALAPKLCADPPSLVVGHRLGTAPGRPEPSAVYHRRSWKWASCSRWRRRGPRAVCAIDRGGLARPLHRARLRPLNPDWSDHGVSRL
jgi:hypothetical protein